MNRPRLQIAFLTGPVHPHSAALHPRQTAFLARLQERLRGNADPKRDSVTHTNRPVTNFDVAWVDRDFPYPTQTGIWSPIPLWRASARNVRNFLGARLNRARTQYREHLITFLEQASTTVFLAGSCGLELLAGLELPEAALNRLTVIAYAPVARRPLPCTRLITVRARFDILSLFFFPRADYLISGGHLDALVQPEFLEVCVAVIHPLLSFEGRPHPSHAAAL